MHIKALSEYLQQNKADFEIIPQTSQILTLADAAEYFPIEQAAPTLVTQTEGGLLAVFSSPTGGRVDFNLLKNIFSFQKMKMADPKRVFAETG